MFITTVTFWNGEPKFTSCHSFKDTADMPKAALPCQAAIRGSLPCIFEQVLQQKHFGNFSTSVAQS